LAKQVELLKLAGFRLEGAWLKTRALQHQHGRRLFALPDTADAELIEFLVFLLGHCSSFALARSLLQSVVSWQAFSCNQRLFTCVQNAKLLKYSS
jgi:hypothetical protein